MSRIHKYQIWNRNKINNELTLKVKENKWVLRRDLKTGKEGPF